MTGFALFIATIAQQAPAAAPPPPPAALAPPTGAAPALPETQAAPDPQRIAAATALIDALHIERQYDALFAQMLPPLTQQVFSSIRDNATVDARIRSYLADEKHLAAAQRLFAAEALAGFKRRYAAFKSATAAEYARAFTLEELVGLASFYASPLGQKILSVQPMLQQRLFPIGANAGRDVGVEAMRNTLEKLLPGEQPPQT